ncbi:sorting nexin-21 isoform X2 [Hyla sarda]|uniref:sorting nexin-21 isoform X2 n=1 Tax=Hyla sarda TaxID=327740 RepID=UPI0024C25E50|nr:sorting nexin-21 isoform X2 [Hyla sarda]XP_056405733.1 sorting nexin-21 isoform X2 [Hyla sarda]
MKSLQIKIIPTSYECWILSPGSFTMASKLFRRFRASTLRRQRGPGPPEEPPEIAELVDDADGLSVRLSGTLSLSEDSLGSEESDSTESRCIEELNSSSLLTQQLREMWASTRGHSLPVRLTFEVTEANVVKDVHAKYVVYTIYLLHSGQFDPSPAFITCRYSDLERLRKTLSSRYPDEMSSVSFPHKRLHKNFTAQTIAKRSRAFEQFLCYVSSVPALRQSAEFLGFFYLRDMQKAQHLTCTSLYQLALPLWMNCWRLQEKLCPAGPSAHRLLVLAGLVVCHQEMDSLPDAQAFSERAISLFQDSQENAPFLVSFLHAHIQLSWRVGVDKRSSEATLLRLQEAGHATHNAPSLKEVLIRETDRATT